MSKPAFAKPDDYLRFFDQPTRQWLYLHLIEAEGGILYPFRFGSLEPGSEQLQATTFSDLAPDKDSSHIYQCFLGLYPEVWYKVWHPYNIKRLSLDERVSQVSENLVSILRYEDSPYDLPTHSLWLDEQRFPAIQPRNVGRTAVNPKIEFMLMKYRVEFDQDLAPETKSKLISGEIPSLPINFGGEI